MTPIAPASCMDFDRIDALLAAWQWLWQPAPFTATPAWQSRCPALYQTLANLSESDYLALLQNESRCLDWLCEFLPELAELRPFQDHAVPLTTSAREQSRKQRQVRAFADAVQPGGRRVIEWCAGQGWLLEELARRQPDKHHEGFEWQARLCAQGNARLHAAGLAARLLPTDVLRDPISLNAQDSLVALHACGHLHQALLHKVVQQPVQDLALSPCCYHLGTGQALSQRGQRAQLKAADIDRHLAVQDSGVGHGNRQRRAERGSQWRLGYDLLQRHLTGADRYRPTPSWPGALWQGCFADFCAHCARHHGINLPDDIDYDEWQRRGEHQHRLVRRLELPRRQFRRLLEWWLVLDMAWYLAEQGYRTRVQVFCATPLTPRNLLLEARRD